LTIATWKAETIYGRPDRSNGQGEIIELTSMRDDRDNGSMGSLNALIVKEQNI